MVLQLVNCVRAQVLADADNNAQSRSQMKSKKMSNYIERDLAVSRFT